MAMTKTNFFILTNLENFEITMIYNTFVTTKIQKAKKAKLRRIFIDKRLSLSDREREIFSEKIADNFFKAFKFNDIRVLHCFLPLEKFAEVDTFLIFKRIWNEFPEIKTVVPKMNLRDNELDSVLFNESSTLEKNQWGVREPIDGEYVSSKDIDLVILPLLCFDLRGFRVGYGKGFYDRFLSSVRQNCLKIGLSFFDPVDEIIDVSINDVKMDFCVTPDRVFNFECDSDSNRK